MQARDVVVPDLRAGFAYVMAALIAKGTSTLSGLHFLERGYSGLYQKLANLGVDLSRTTVGETPVEKSYQSSFIEDKTKTSKKKKLEVLV